MRRLLLLALGGAIGYVMGAKAGRERYDQIASLARRWMRSEDRSTPWVDSSGPGAGTTTAPVFGEPFASTNP